MFPFCGSDKRTGWFSGLLNTNHFIENPQVAFRSGSRIGSPGDALVWVIETVKGNSIGLSLELGFNRTNSENLNG